MNALQNFLYNNILGRLILKILIQPPVSKLGGLILNSRLSVIYINRFIRNNHIDMSDYPKCKYSSFNDFFTRTILAGRRNIDLSAKAFISPCDSALTVYDISEDSSFHIKKSVYSVSDLVNFDCSDYLGGKCLVFRLAVDNYHRYCYVDNGHKEGNVRIKGVLHTVMPISADLNVFSKNSREYTILHTDNFGDIIQIEVGALMVGKINNYHSSCSFLKGEEKGRFEFGGSTIVLLVKNNTINISDNIIENSQKGIETKVKYGETIGNKN